MDHTATYGDVGHVIRDAVEQLDLPFSFRELLLIPLSQPDKVLGAAERPFWPALVLASAAATNGDPRAAMRLAAAIEIFIAAADVLDELEDEDDSALVRAAGPARALNAASALMALSHATMVRLHDDGVQAERVLDIISVFTKSMLCAAAGQNLDLEGEIRIHHTLDDALDIARRKGGVLAGMACRMGAMLGTDDDELLATYEAFGSHLGVIGQLDNDIHDVQNVELKTDSLRGKATLPRVYEEHGRSAHIGEQPLSPIAAQKVDEGAAHFVWVVIEIERQAARRELATLANREQPVERLDEFLV